MLGRRGEQLLRGRIASLFGEGRKRRGLKVSRCGEAAKGFSVVEGRVRPGLEVSRCGARQGLRSGRRQGSSWSDSEHIMRAHMGSSGGERACAAAREKSALPLLKFARFVCAAGASAGGGVRCTPDETPSPP